MISPAGSPALLRRRGLPLCIDDFGAGAAAFQAGILELQAAQQTNSCEMARAAKEAGKGGVAPAASGKAAATVMRLQTIVSREIAATDAYLVSRRQRKKVEMLFAHLKRILRLRRLRLRGPRWRASLADDAVAGAPHRARARVTGPARHGPDDPDLHDQEQPGLGGGTRRDGRVP